MITLPSALQAASLSALDHLLPFVDPTEATARGELMEALRPSLADCEHVFVAGAAEQAFAHYTAEVWTVPPTWAIAPDHRRVRIRGAAFAEDFELGDVRARAFPTTYASIGRQLRPRSIWVAWTFLAPGATEGLDLDGLVEIERGRWVWFPEPWKALGHKG